MGSQHCCSKRTISTISLHREFLLFLVLFSWTLPSHALVDVTDCGVNPVKYGDTAMVFYANANYNQSGGSAPVAARLKMEKCCWEGPNKTSSCEGMRLISGLGAVLNPGDSFRLQMFFVNYDLYSRDGTCTLAVLSKSYPGGGHWDHGKELTIPFKTDLVRPAGMIRNMLVSVGWGPKSYHECHSGNGESVQECANLECQLRFSGTRSFYNVKTRECEQTPDCVDEKTILSPFSGKCEKIHDVKEVQLSLAHEMLPLVETTVPPPPPPHVETSMDTESQSSDEMNAKTRAILICAFVALGVLLLIIIFLIWLQIRNNRKCKDLKGDGGDDDEEEEGDDDEEEEEEDADAVIAEVANRREPSVNIIQKSSSNHSSKDDEPPSLTPSHPDPDGYDIPSKVEISNSSHSTNQNPNEKPATRSASTDELLAMNRREQYGAHVPITPVPTKISEAGTILDKNMNTAGFIPKVAATTELRTLMSPSHTQLTAKKKEEWANFIESVSVERLHPPKPAHQTISVSTSGEEESSRGSHSFVDFNFFHKDRTRTSGEAAKVQSLPEMNLKCSSVPTHNQIQMRPRESTRKSSDAMTAQEFASRQEAYNLLRSLSKTTLPSIHSGDIGLADLNRSFCKRSTGFPSSHSIWSNVASENAAEPDVASASSSLTDLRTKSIYGNMEDGEDSDDALEKLESSTQITTKQSVAEIFQQNQKLYGFPQPDRITEHRKGTLRQQCRMESDRVPSDTYATDNSTLPSPAPSITEFWTQQERPGVVLEEGDMSKWLHRFSNSVNSMKSSGGGDCRPAKVTEEVCDNPQVRWMSPEIKSAYQIKSSLQKSLRTPASRSDIDFF